MIEEEIKRDDEWSEDKAASQLVEEKNLEKQIKNGGRLMETNFKQKYGHRNARVEKTLRQFKGIGSPITEEILKLNREGLDGKIKQLSNGKLSFLSIKWHNESKYSTFEILKLLLLTVDGDDYETVKRHIEQISSNELTFRAYILEKNFKYEENFQ